MESEGMLRHLVFFEELGRMDETDPSWRAVSAGLVTMRLVDQWIADGRNTRVDSWSVSAVREAIAQVGEGAPVRRMLSGIVDTITSSSRFDAHTVVPRLMAYGQALEYDAKYTLAADVYQTIIAHAHPVDDADLVVSAHIQLAFCLRTLGDLDDAARVYARASQVAFAAGDLIGVLRGRLGDAKIAIARGNMPQAEEILEETVARARETGHADIQSRALHERAYLDGLRGNHERAIEFAYQALAHSPTQRQRDRILTDIATGFRYLGLLDVARDAYLVLAATAQEQYIRWMSEINLMALAATQGAELQFDKYRRDLEQSDFTPQLRVTYLLHVGRGYSALGHSELAVPYLERAVDVAAEHKLNQLMFEAEEALQEARRYERVAASKPAAAPASGVRVVIDAIQEMKQLAGIG